MKISPEYGYWVGYILILVVGATCAQPLFAQHAFITDCDINDIDQDDDGLIEICSLEGLDAIRYQLDGSGYKASSGAAKITAGCSSGVCKGYELIRDLDFNDDASYTSTANKVTWTTGNGFPRIGSDTNRFTGIFNGNGYTIANLMIKRGAAPIPANNHQGLFANVSGHIRNIGLLNASVSGAYYVGVLAGEIRDGATVTNSYTTGTQEGRGFYYGGIAGSVTGKHTLRIVIQLYQLVVILKLVG